MIIIVFVVPLQTDICHYEHPPPSCVHIPTAVVVVADAVMDDRLCCGFCPLEMAKILCSDKGALMAAAIATPQDAASSGQ